ncbi:MAG: tRNA-dihydrouridine synthase family protein [Treponemataceae bacterium]
MSVPYVLAPMATLSHRALRELLEDFGGCDLYFSEMIGTAPFLNGGRLESYYSDPLPRPDRLIYQIVGGDAAQLAKVAALLNGWDAAGIDVNMGCSAPEIVKTGAGVRWMANEDAARSMIAGVRKVVKKRLSVKLRLGADEDFERLVRFCRMLQDEGVETLTLHPRTATEKLRRSARWDYVGRLRVELSIPVVGNGDIDSVASLLSRALGPCDGVMVGRAAVQMPWIFAAAREKTTGIRTLPAELDLEAIAFRFLDLLAKYQPPEFHDTRSRRFFFYFCDNLKWAHHVKTLINRETELGAVGAVLRSHFAQNKEERFIRPLPS